MNEKMNEYEKNAREQQIDEVDEHNKAFMARHRLAMQSWYDKHQTMHPGVYKDKTGKLFMANRKQRLAHNKRKK